MWHGSHLRTRLNYRPFSIAMSFRSAAKKTAWCQKALELVQAHHRVIPTSALLRELTGAAAKASVA